MQSRPTTEQILNDLAREVKESILPEVSDPTQKVNFEMMEQLLRACAKRSAHEIAWMSSEVKEIEKLAIDILAIEDDLHLAETLKKYQTQKSESLHLEDQVQNYHLAGKLFEQLIVTVFEIRDKTFSNRLTELIRSRSEHESELINDFYFPGRS